MIQDTDGIKLQVDVVGLDLTALIDTRQVERIRQRPAAPKALSVFVVDEKTVLGPAASPWAAVEAGLVSRSSEMPSESTYKQNYGEAKAAAVSDPLAQKL